MLPEEPRVFFCFEGVFVKFLSNSRFIGHNGITQTIFALQPPQSLIDKYGLQEKVEVRDIVRISYPQSKIIPLSEGKNAQIIILCGFGGEDSELSLEFEDLTGTIEANERKLTILKREESSLLKMLNQIKNHPDEFLEDYSDLYRNILMVRKYKQEGSEETQE